MNKLKILAAFFLFICVLFSGYAQTDDGKSEFNPLIVGVPSLTIAPDARGGGM